MDFENLQKLIKGNRVKVLDGKGSIQIDLEYNNFLALVNLGLNKLGEEDTALIDIYDTLEEALQAIIEY